ncbi:unnamed protein product [Cyprideis torosa]|uniref:Uncharacterized protein n=1 Tax=Cyprideis torosa TaxID=163714 RepID=A0A7R8ZJR0_9CRUS|nr:unnamed protein product [Cyprideis torosa]CAG0887721.1 unnamed protein product [Cyprideis torosa]
MTLWGLLAPARLCCSSSLRLTPVCCTAHHVTRRKHTWDRLPSAEAEEEATSASSIQPRQSRTDHLGIQFREFKERYRMLDQSSDVMAKDGITEVVEGARYGKYRFFEVHTAAKELAEEVSDLNNAELMYLMFSLVVKKQWLPERLSRDIDHETGRLFESKGVTLQEIGIICAAFFRCKQRLTSENFRRLVPHAVRFVPSAVDDPIPYTFLLKTLRYSANMNDWRQIRHLLEEALPFIPDMTTATCAHLARLCTAHVPISVPTVMEQVVNTLVSRLDPLLKQDRRGPPNDPIRIKDLEQMVQTLSCVGLPSRYLNQLIVQELLDNPNMIKGQEGRRVLSLANLLSALSHTEDCPVSLVRILMEEELEKIFFIPSVTVNYPDILRTVFELEQLGVIEFPDEPNLPRMPARLRELAVQLPARIGDDSKYPDSYLVRLFQDFLPSETFDQTPAIHNISKKKELAAKVWD